MIAKDAKCHPRRFGDRESPWFASRVVAAHLGLKSSTLGQQMKQRRTSEEAERQWLRGAGVTLTVAVGMD